MGWFAPYRGRVADVLPPVARAAGAASSMVLLQRQAAELLSFLPDVGEPRVQRTVDALVEQASDTLLALADTVEAGAVEAGAADPGVPVSPARRTMGPPTAPADQDGIDAEQTRTTPDHGLGVLGGGPLRVVRDDASLWEPR